MCNKTIEFGQALLMGFAIAIVLWGIGIAIYYFIIS